MRFSTKWLSTHQAVLATDIADKELKTLRNARWDSAFAEGQREEDPQATVNRKATIVIEHLIQASDVAHTMQHWYVCGGFLTGPMKVHLLSSHNDSDLWIQGISTANGTKTSTMNASKRSRMVARRLTPL